MADVGTKATLASRVRRGCKELEEEEMEEEETEEVLGNFETLRICF